ncbi:MAG: DUF2284 domain-containing protein [Acidobacteria bacterium]|nr:DUF2284 domain-containing protein [Acidobacteriota bacterium]
MVDPEALITIALESGASGAAVLDTSVIEFHEEFRKACERNFCGKYDTNWMGPPAIGPIEVLKRRALNYRQGLLLQSVHSVKSSFDIKGMIAKAAVHEAIFRTLLDRIRQEYPSEDFLPLNAGCCSICEKCSYPGEPCRNPDRAVASVEAYGMDVIALQKKAGVRYYHGKEAVCYVGLILFNPASHTRSQ